MTDMTEPCDTASRFMSGSAEIVEFIRNLEGYGRGNNWAAEMIQHNAKHAVNKDVTKAARNFLRALRKLQQRLQIFEMELDHAETLYPELVELMQPR